MLRGLAATAWIAAGGLAITAAHAIHRLTSVAAPREARAAVVPGAVAQRRCAIYHARFGGTRADLIAVAAVDVINYVVMDVGTPARLPPSIPSAWLSAAFGSAETSWLGEFASSEGALRRAADLCPEGLRCMFGEENCGPAGLR